VPVSVFNAPVDVGTVPLTEPEIFGTVTAPGGDFVVGGLPAGTYGLRASPASCYYPFIRSLIR
jgi:hypothetical protein